MSSIPKISDRLCNAFSRMRGFTVYMMAVFLVIAGLFVAMLFNGLLQQDKTSASQVDKSMAFMAAQSAMQFAERWLEKNSPGVGVKCTAFSLDANLNDSIKVCNQIMSDGESKIIPWSSRYLLKTKLPDGREVKSEFHVAYIGFNDNSGAGVYQITAAGFGRKSDTVAVIQGTYSNGLVSVNSLSNL